MPTIKLSATLIEFLDPLKMNTFYRHRDLWEHAIRKSRDWIDFGLDRGLTLEEIVTPFGIAGIEVNQEDTLAAMAAIWVNAYLDSSLLGRADSHEAH